MKQFESITKQFIPYNGETRILFTIKNDIERNPNTVERQFADLKPQVEIDGELWDVFGVESFSMETIPEGSVLGIYVYPKKVQ